MPLRSPAPNGDPAWPWPEPRLTYANAVLAEAMIAAGVALDDSTLRQRGLDLLAWLVEFETADGHLSPTPVGGRGAEDARPGFDQQPIEVSTLADACARAAAVDAESDLARRRPGRSGLVHGRQRRGTAHVGSGDRRRIRRSARRRGER